MGPSSVPVREAISAGTLRSSDKAAPEIAARFDALVRFASLRLGRQLGREVLPGLSRKEFLDPGLRAQALVSSLATTGTLEAAIRVSDAVAPLNVVVDLRAGRVTCSVDIDAPKDGRSLTRVNWLLRQLKSAPDSLRVEAFTLRARGAGVAELLRDVRAKPSLLAGDPKKEIRAFRIAMTVPMGAKRGRGRGGFVDSVLGAIDGFYGEVMQHLKAWTATPPRLREPAQIPAQRPAALASTALSSQDGAEAVGTEGVASFVDEEGSAHAAVAAARGSGP